MTKPVISPETIRRIERMEQIFDTLLTALQTDPSAIFTDATLHASLLELTQYYDSGQWLRDYDLDEQGKLPAGLKRGVLAQDAVYDFLTDIK